MAIFQFHMQVIGRSEGRSAVAASAYRSAEKIYNEYTGNTEDYTKKKWVAYREVMLPPNAPEAFKDRAVLWNSVEKEEKGRNARLSREIEAALPQELSMEENIRLVREFVQDTFIDDGMIADVNIHNPPLRDEEGMPVDEDGRRVREEKNMVFRNPHVHILLTVRPLDEKGNWMAKSQKEYVCRKGKEEKAFTAEEWKKAKAEGWEKQYQYWKDSRKVWMTPSEAFAENRVRVSKYPKSTLYGRREEKTERWNAKDAVFAYRQSWEKHVNQALERAGRPERVDCRSYAEQGVDKVSGIHLGSHTARQKDADRYRLNEDIKELNQKNQTIRKTLEELGEEIRRMEEGIYEEEAEQLGRLRGEIIKARYYMEEIREQQEVLEKEMQPLKESLSRINTARENILQKDQEAEERLAGFRKELEGKFPAWSDRPVRIQAGIEAEQEGIRFRKERFGQILKEEGFSGTRDYQEKADMLAKLEKELGRLAEKTSFYEEQIQGYTARYEELYQMMTQKDAASRDFCSKREKWSRVYEERSADVIRKKQRAFRPDIFRQAVHKTDYVLGHALYLAGRAEYLMGKMQEAAEQDDGERRRSR